MKLQIRISLGMLTALFSIVGLFASSAAFADDDGSGCPNPEGRPTSNIVEASYEVSGNDTTYKFESVDQGGDKGIPGLIEYCVYPDPKGENTLPDSVVVDKTPGTGAEGFNKEFFEDPPAPDAFSFDRAAGGNESNIPLDGTTRTMGTATWSGGAPTDQLLLLHINDEDECDRLELNSETCFVFGEIKEVPPAAALTAEKTAEPSFERKYEWDIEKNVDKTKVVIADGGKATFTYTVTVTHDEGTDGGWLVKGTITVNNPNSGAVTGVDVEDSINDANADCNVSEGTEAEIPKEGSKEFSYECVYEDEPESDSETNTATVSWPEQTVDGALLDEGEAEAEAEVDWAGTEPELIDEQINVEDTLGGPFGFVSALKANPVEFEYEYTFEGDPPGTCTEHDNEATFETNDTETKDSAEQTVEVCVGADLEVEKDATPSFKRTFEWEIDKEVDKTKVTGQEGGSATFKYTIKVTKGEGVDSGWLVTGTITVTNPNDFQDIEEVDVTDLIEGETNATCTVEGEETKEATIPAEASEEFAYECKYSAAPANEKQTNKATAIWDPEAASTPTGEASGTKEFDWSSVEPELVDNCLEEVNDTVDGVPTTIEEEVCESTEYNPEVTYEIKSGCVKHTNTAELITDGGATDKDTVEVEVCGFKDSGALTMGFWQNKNGQKIITDQASKGTCPSATWLRQYNPFKDLKETATCKEVAAYVTSIIKAANAGGSAMNAMLKAQMLATALDVYFSDPALGGNKIKAPAPIGSFVVDLTKVCKNIPTCSVFENVSSAFEGKASMSVLQMLTYAASQSNSGGTTWYGQVKATQELAKDAFDAINNEVAFGP